TPPAAHPWWGEHFIRVGSGERTVYPGFAILAMAIVGAIGARTRRRIWIAIAAVFAVLALGPFLQVNGHAGRLFTYAQSHFSVPLPYLLFNKIPILNGARNPGRFGVMTALSLDVLAALGIVVLARGRLRVEVALSLALIAITLVEFLPPNRRELMTTRVQ